METYPNLVVALNDLKKKGYVEDFNLRQNWIECREGQCKIFYNEFEIEKVFRFEANDSSADSTSILYVITSEKFDLKGTLINAYSIYSDDIADKLLEKLRIE